MKWENFSTLTDSQCNSSFRNSI